VTGTAVPTREERLAAAAQGMTLALHASVAPDRPAILTTTGDTGGDRTFAELNANANRFVRALRCRGVGAGDSLVLVCANRAEFAEVLAACQRMGVRATPANWHLTGDELAYIVGNCDAKVLVGDARFAPALTSAATACPGASVRVSIGGDVDGFEPFGAVVAPEPGDDIDDPIVGRTMLYTSGTTGRPKGVDRPPATAQATPLTTALTRASRYDPTADVHLCTGPLYHAAPLAFSLSGPLAAGVTVVLMDGWEADETLLLIERHRVTHTHMVPTMFHRLLALPDDRKASADLSSLRFVLHGAAPCPVTVKQALIEWLGPVVYEYYAATEGGGTFVTPEEWLRKPGTVGKPAADDLVRVLDAAGEPQPPDQIGTVYLRAPAEGRFRYYKDGAKTASSYRGEYFTLGDHGYLDDDGYLFLTGRSAELIISGGVNVYPAEVDAVLLTHPAVGDAGTIGVPDEEWGEQVVSVVELKPGVEATPALAAELIAWCRDRLAHFKCPRAVEFVAELPRHDNGKLYRTKLRQQIVGDDDPTGHRR
jgi:long-chain acyl-CoA synthetase